MLKRTRARHFLLRSSVASLLIAAVAAFVAFSMPGASTTEAVARVVLVVFIVLAAVTLVTGLRRSPPEPERTP
jgi:uncharacterized membrane protein YtjA (UPF0391 family)